MLTPTSSNHIYRTAFAAPSAPSDPRRQGRTQGWVRAASVLVAVAGLASAAAGEGGAVAPVPTTPSDAVVAPGGGVIVPKPSIPRGAPAMRFSRSSGGQLPGIMQSSSGQVFVATDPAPLPRIDPSQAPALRTAGLGAGGREAAPVLQPTWVRTAGGFERHVPLVQSDGTVKRVVEVWVAQGSTLTRVGPSATPLDDAQGASGASLADAGAVAPQVVASADNVGPGVPELGEPATPASQRAPGAPINHEALAALDSASAGLNPASGSGVATITSTTPGSPATLRPKNAAGQAVATGGAEPRRGPIRRFELKRLVPVLPASSAGVGLASGEPAGSDAPAGTALASASTRASHMPGASPAAAASPVSAASPVAAASAAPAKAPEIKPARATEPAHASVEAQVP